MQHPVYSATAVRSCLCLHASYQQMLSPYLNSLICQEDLLAAWCLALQTGRTTYTSCIPAQLLLIQAVLLLPYILSDVVHCHLTVAVSCHSAESQQAT